MANKIACYILLLAVLMMTFTTEVEGRRKILKGRRTVTRTYVADSTLPAWAYVLLVAFGEMILGGIIFLIMKKIILDKPITGTYVVDSP